MRPGTSCTLPTLRTSNPMGGQQQHDVVPSKFTQTGLPACAGVPVHAHDLGAT